ncbi:hypothetical protein LP420_14915 [Massilia sp. B-10]|nr:hypothetical protein LP420_14915 [Massilia sp. B-10]UUZ56290.1 hypothetical protein LP419_14330 [Massilia sp. H-1]
MNTLKVAIFALAWLLGPIQCRASEIARLFVAQKDGHVAFFLPVVHTPTAVEKDAYLQKIIEPVFRRSTTLYDESVPIAHLYPTAIHPCRRQLRLPLVSQRKLDAISDPIVRHDIFTFPVPSILKETDFIKVMLVIFGPVVPDLKNLPPSFVVTESQVATALARNYQIDHQSIESMDDWKSVYCSMSLKEKERMVDAMFSDASTNFNVSEYQRSQAYVRAIACIDAALANADACYDSLTGQTQLGNPAWRSGAGKTKLLLSGRNKIWVAKIKANSKIKGIPFYAFGAAHFLHNANEPGLFTQLKRAGFRFKRIENLSDIPDAVMSQVPLSKSAPEASVDLSENR